MVGGIEIPPLEYLRRIFLDTGRHVIKVETVLEELQIGSSDPQRPHDIMGDGNKFQDNVLFGLAMQYAGSQNYEMHVCPALRLHRSGQVHHQMWNGPNPDASEDALKLGATDAICSLLEDRPYQGGVHTFEEIENDIIPQNKKIVQREYMKLILSEMRKIELPKVELITSLNPQQFQKQLEDMNLSRHTKRVICDRVQDAHKDLFERHGLVLF